MTEKKTFISRLLLYAAGFIILLFVFFLITKNVDISNTDRFIWASAGSVYLVAFCPFLFSPFGEKEAAEKPPSLILLWLGAIAYMLVSIANIILVRLVLPVYASVIIQCIAFIAYAVLTYSQLR